MKIIKMNTSVIKLTVDHRYFFQNNSELTPKTLTSHEWSKQSNDCYLSEFDIFFQSISSTTKEFSVDFHHKFELLCEIEDIENDAKLVLELRDKFILSTQLILMQSTVEHYHLLKYPTDFFINGKYDNYKINSEFQLKKEIKAIKRAMGILTLDEMSEEERQIMLGLNEN